MNCRTCLLSVLSVLAAAFLLVPRLGAATLEPLEVASKDGVHIFAVEMALTPEQQAQGLMYRKELPEGQGMLFDFKRDQEATFWMKNTYVPLDMIFIRADGRIHRIAANTDAAVRGPGIVGRAGARGARSGRRHGQEARHRARRPGRTPDLQQPIAPTPSSEGCRKAYTSRALRMSSRRRRRHPMRHLLLAGALTFAVNSTLPASAEPSIKDLAARTEIRPFETMTLSDRQFLTGDKNGTAVMIAGELRIPQGTGGRLPAVVLLHGSRRRGRRPRALGEAFQRDGHRLLPDRQLFRPRHRADIEQPDAARPLQHDSDAYRGTDLLAAHPRIDPNRIAVIGFSRGGQSALYSSLKRFQSVWTPRVTFAAHIPLYASCNPTLVGDTDVSAVPIRLYHGTADDYVPVAPCRAYVERLRAAGRDAQLTEYPGAHHAYDSPFAPKVPTIAPAAQSVRACSLKEEPLGTIINASTGQPFTYGDPCIPDRSPSGL